MKTLIRSNYLIPTASCLLFAIAAVSCQTRTVPPTTKQPVSFKRSNWVKVSTQPPSYYPRGISANTDTDHWSGEWIYTEDENNTRYFIPHRGLGGMNRQALLHEAMSGRSERKLARIAEEDRQILTRNLRNMILFGPPVCGALLMGGAVGAAPPYRVDLYRLQKEWHNARMPHPVQD